MITCYKSYDNDPPTTVLLKRRPIPPNLSIIVNYVGSRWRSITGVYMTVQRIYEAEGSQGPSMAIRAKKRIFLETIIASTKFGIFRRDFF